MMASPIKSKRRLSRGRRSLCHQILYNSEEVLSKDIPVTEQPCDRLETLLTRSAMFAIKASLPLTDDTGTFLEDVAKEQVEKAIKRMKDNGLFLECTKPSKISRLESPTENEIAIEDEIKKFEKENDRWELLLTKYKTMDECSVKENEGSEGDPVSANSTTGHIGFRERNSYYAAKLNKLDTTLERIRIHMKVVKQKTSEMQLSKKEVESTLNSLAAKLHASVNDNADARHIVLSLLKSDTPQ